MQSGIYQENGRKIRIIKAEEMQMEGVPKELHLFQLSIITTLDMPDGDVNIVENGQTVEKIFIYKKENKENGVTGQMEYKYVTVRNFIKGELKSIFEIIKDGQDQEEPPKWEVVKKLEELLLLTRCDLEKLEYNEQQELVMIHFNGGGSRVANVAADSALALIHDVIKNI